MENEIFYVKVQFNNKREKKFQISQQIIKMFSMPSFK